MDRLTERTHGSIADELVEEMGNPIDCVFVKNEHDTCAGICCRNESCDDCPLNKVIRKLAEYEDAEEQGLILRLPCKVEEEIYALTKTFDAMKGKMFYKIKTFKVDKFLYNSLKNFTIVGIEQQSGGFFEKPFSLRDIGKTVFLTREEAERALEEMKAGAE